MSRRKRLVLLSLIEEINQEDVLLGSLIQKSNEIKRHRRFWIHDILKQRRQYGSYYHLVKELELDADKYHEYFRMSPAEMEILLGIVGPAIRKDSSVRETIEEKQRLAICVRFLATGESYTSLASQYRVGRSTLSKLVPEVCEAIWATMRDQFMPFPKTSDEWRAKATRFFDRWDYPHCLGALDGKHVVVKAPPNTCSLYFNYKHSFSIVLLALVDADYRFIYVDIGAYGKQSDGGVFSASSLGKGLATPNSLQIPEEDILLESEELGSLPYVIVGDEAFPLQKHLMRPYPGKSTTKEQQSYNYRHSRARRVVENAFGLLSQRWRIFHTKIAVMPDSVGSIVKATTVLHNMLQKQSSAITASTHTETSVEAEGLQRMQRVGNRATNEAMQIRDKFNTYFNTRPLPWQDSYIQRGLHV